MSETFLSVVESLMMGDVPTWLPVRIQIFAAGKLYLMQRNFICSRETLFGAEQFYLQQRNFFDGEQFYSTHINKI